MRTKFSLDDLGAAEFGRLLEVRWRARKFIKQNRPYITARVRPVQPAAPLVNAKDETTTTGTMVTIDETVCGDSVSRLMLATQFDVLSLSFLPRKP